ncbi:hypothetical protein GDO78_008568 [Eleutherodactylus coqui]|uniref:Uncharacterized protein n=1 Tax=Eleutherodactylus coqui TaxID=57060 RepID=A0A8J6FEI9_ELECQ|nr:hypothetical protein GDO78_008568 [Eleutherodactylus coqui]
MWKETRLYLAGFTLVQIFINDLYTVIKCPYNCGTISTCHKSIKALEDEDICILFLSLMLPYLKSMKIFYQFYTCFNTMRMLVTKWVGVRKQGMYY